LSTTNSRHPGAARAASVLVAAANSGEKPPTFELGRGNPLPVPECGARDMSPCFDSIESAQDFMQILAETILEAMTDLNSQRQEALRDGENRRAQAIELAMFKLKMLSCYVFKSRRMLNDLRTIRRLILNERLTTVEQVVAAM
jgi:hypothetical protein